MDDGKNMAARIGGIMKAPKKHLCGSFQMVNMIVLSPWTVSRPETQFIRF